MYKITTPRIRHLLRTSVFRLGALAAAIGVLGSTGHAQEGGVLFDMTLSQSLEVSDNLELEDPAVSGARATTTLDGTLSSVTRNQSFVLGFSAGFEVDRGVFELGDTGIDATYTRFGQGSEFELNAGYSRRGITAEFQDDAFETIVSSGTQIDFGYGARLLVGENAPLGLEFSVRRDEREFESPDPDAVNSFTTRADATVTARIDQATTGRATLSFSEKEDEDVANQIESTTDVGLGITRELQNATTFSADISFTRVAITETEMAIRTTDVTSGIGWRLAFDRELGNGSLSGSLERRVTQNGPIDELRLGRETIFPASSLFLEGGLILTNEEDLSPLLGLVYRRDLRDGNLRVSLEQSAGIDGDDNTTLSTRADGSFTRNINDISSVAVSFGVRNDSTIGANDTTRRIDASLTYERELTALTSLSAGYEYARVSETAQNDRVSNTVFLTVSRSFSARP